MARDEGLGFGGSRFWEKGLGILTGFRVKFRVLVLGGVLIATVGSFSLFVALPYGF